MVILMKKITVRSLCLIAILGGLAAVTMLLEFPLLFIAPGFYKLNFSEVIVLLGAFALGPIEGVIIELIKIVVNTLINGTTTAYVGEIANFVSGCAFILPASLIYRFKRTRKGAFAGLIAGTLVMTAAGGLLNYYALIPAYAKAFAPLDVIIKAGTAINPAITDLKTFVLIATVPFNLLKGVASSVITLLIYKRVRFVLHR